MPNVRTTAAALLAEADLYTDPDQPVHGVADIADALDVPVTAVRTAAVEAGAPRVGNALALTKKLALEVAEQLDAIGWSLGGQDEADEDEADDDDDDLEADEDEADEDDDDLEADEDEADEADDLDDEDDEDLEDGDAA